MMTSLLRRLCFGSILLILGYTQVSAQCDPPELLPTVMCSEAPEVCLQNACYSTQPIPDVGFIGFCGPMTIINNPQFFAFTPIDTFALIEILVTSCNGTGNSALQSAIIPGCNWTIDSVLVCDNGTPVNGTMSLPFDQFVPGEPYLLLIDGSNGAVCEYEITNSVNIFEPGITETLTDITPSSVSACQGQDVLAVLAEPAITNAAQYSWSLPWGEEITSVNDLNTIVPDDAEPGTYEVCVFAFSGCDTMDMPFPCFELTITEVDDRDKAPAIFCQEDLPFIWQGNVVNGPNTYSATFDNAEGCPFDSVWIVDIYPEVPQGNIDTFHCGIQLEYENVIYDVDGSYLLEYPQQGLNGCDSSALLDVTLIGLEGFIDYECNSSEFVIEPIQLIYTPSSANIIYEWFESGELIAGQTLDELVVVEGGTYSLTITLEANGTECVFDLGEVDINVSEIVPPAPLLAHGDTTICPGTNVIFQVANIDPEVTGYLWYTPPNIFFSADESGIIEMDITDATDGSEICVSAYNDCGESERTCFNLNLIQLPEVELNTPAALCQDSTGTISFTGSASENAEILWDFGGGTIVSGMGEGPYDINWQTPGPKTITIQVAEIGCDTVTATETILVESVTRPLINCISTINSITFYWDNVPEALQYDVEVEGESSMMVTDTFLTVNGLNAGDSLTISVFAIGQNQCISEISVFGCSAQNCLPANIELSGIDTICLNQSTGVYPLYAIVNGDTTTGTWSGPGIVNPSTGVFDPLDPSVVAGSQNISFQYTDQNDCTSQSAFNIFVFDSINASFEIDSVICQIDAAVTNFLGDVITSGNYQWTFDNGSILSGTNEGPYQIQWNTPGIKQVNLSIENYGCISETFSQNIEIKPGLQHPIINCEPNTSSVEFSWDMVPNSTGFQVNLLQGTGGIQNGNQILFDNLSPGDSILIELVTMSDGICPELRDTTLCVARTCPQVEISIDSVSPICLDAGISAFDLIVNIQNGNGNGIWSGPGIIDATTGQFDPNASDAGVGIHQIVYTYQDDGCTFIANTDIVINEIPEALISNTVLQLTCSNGNQLVLDGTSSSPSAGLQYSWTTTNGLIISGEDGPQPTIGAAGVYQLRVQTMQGCVDSTSIEITQDANAPTADAGEDDRLDCNQLMVEIGGNSTDGSDITYLWSTNDGSITSDATQKTIIVDAPGTYELQVSNSTNGCVSSDVVEVTENIALPTLSASAPDTLYCDSESIMIQGTADGGGAQLNIAWNTTNGNIASGANTLNPEVSSPGIYVMVVTNMDNGCVDSTTVETFENVELPLLSIMVNDTFYCETESIFIQGGADAGGAELSINWVSTNGSILSGENTLMPEVGSPGNYTMIVQNIENGCIDSIDVDVIADDNVITNLDFTLSPITCFGKQDGGISILSIEGGQAPFTYVWNTGQTGESIEGLDSGDYSVSVSDENGCFFETSFLISEPPLFTTGIEIDGAEVNFVSGDSVTVSLINLSDPGAVESIFWMGTTADMNCMNSQQCKFEVIENTIVQAEVIDTNGCLAIADFEINVVTPRVTFIPNVFTPNGDNQNDYFTVFGSENIVNISYLRIYDRWGEVVYEIENIPPNTPELGWNGKFNNGDVLPGVYIYSIMIQYDDGVEEFLKGDLTLLR